VPLDSIFETDVQSVKRHNEIKAKNGEESDAKLFGRWALNYLADKGGAVNQRSQSKAELASHQRSEHVLVRDTSQPKIILGASQEELKSKDYKHMARLF